jgi:hypothetical protein
MKTICRPSDHEDRDISLYLFPDEEIVTIRDDVTIIGAEDNPSLMILDCSTSTAVLYEGVEEPEGYIGWKYRYNPTDGWVEYEGWAQIEKNMQEALNRSRPPVPGFLPDTPAV